MAMQTIDERTRGVFVIAPTPFDDASAPGLASTDWLVDLYLDKGIDGITIPAPSQRRIPSVRNGSQA